MVLFGIYRYNLSQAPIAAFNTRELRDRPKLLSPLPK